MGAAFFIETSKGEKDVLICNLAECFWAAFMKQANFLMCHRVVPTSLSKLSNVGLLNGGDRVVRTQGNHIGRHQS
jgi:hypothetical protein